MGGTQAVVNRRCEPFSIENPVLIFVINSLTRGGAEKNLCLLANHLAAQGREILILTLDEGTAEPACLLHAGIEHQALGLTTSGRPWPEKIRRLIRLPFSLRRALCASHPDAIISFMDQTNMLCLMAAAGLNIPLIVCERVNPSRSSILEPSMPWPLRMLLPPLRNLLYRRAHKIVVQTADAARYFPPALQKKIVAIPNPVLPPPGEGTADARLPAPCILGMGRLVPQKRFDMLIKAFAAATSSLPEWSLTIAGAGPCLPELKDLAAKMGVQARVFFSGPTSTPCQLMRQAEIFVLSSDYEGFPGVLCEAMSCGVPVISTDCPFGPADIVRHAVDGLLVRPSAAEDLSQALLSLIQNPEKRKLMGLKAAEITGRFELHKIMKEWESLVP